MATTVILGSGIIGLSTAYYLSLSQPGSSIHLVDPSPTLFASASGRAGGFLARDWFSPSLAGLGALSFSEHKRLADEHGGREKWGYMRSTSVSYTPGLTKVKGGKRADDWLREGSSRALASQVTDATTKGMSGENEPSWLKRMEGDEMEVISEEGSTAQVDPLRLCAFLLKICQARGVQLHHPAKAMSVDKDMRDQLSSIRILDISTNNTIYIPCTKILIAAGAWSPQVFATLFPSSNYKLPISSLAGHSLVVRSPRWTKTDENGDQGCHAVFSTDEDGYSPEIFSRMGEEIYIAGLNSSSIPLPTLATESQIDKKSIESLKKTAKRLLGNQIESTEDLEIIREGLCFRPVTSKGVPILAQIQDEKLGGMKTRDCGESGVFLAAGHGPWGISNSLGTGKVMSEIIMGKETSVKVDGLRF